MNRCKAELMKVRGDRKVQERTREQQFSEVPITVDEILNEVGAALFQLPSSNELHQLTETYRLRLAPRQFSRFVNLMVDCYGTPFVRHAGLPVGRPKLSLAS